MYISQAPIWKLWMQAVLVIIVSSAHLVFFAFVMHTRVSEYACTRALVNGMFDCHVTFWLIHCFAAQ